MILTVHKPSGITSHDVVERVRQLTGERKVGHGGTLDPFAEGVLVIGVGRESTKELHQILKKVDKEYVALLRLGQVSTTGDPEGKLTTTATDEDLRKITIPKIEAVLAKFEGVTKQTPPAYSALKIKGTPAYKLARQGKNLLLPEREINIKKLELLEFIPHPSEKGEGPFVKIRAVVSAGTYIRSLAEDIGRGLGVGAYLKELTRTRVGTFKIEESKKLKELEKEYAK